MILEPQVRRLENEEKDLCTTAYDDARDKINPLMDE